MSNNKRLGPIAQSILDVIQESFRNKSPHKEEEILVLRYFERFLYACSEDVLSLFSIDHTYPDISMISADTTLGKQLYINAEIDNFVFGAGDYWIEMDIEDTPNEIDNKMTHLAVELGNEINRLRTIANAIMPGNGYDEKQQTFILMWNPAISSVTIHNHIDSIPYIKSDGFNWSVYEWESARLDDRFVMVRVGDGKTGVVMSGIFTSAPYGDKDWNRIRNNKMVHYMDMKPNLIINPETMPIITTQQLQKEIPDFEWTKGHSGTLLSPQQSRQLEKMIAKYIAIIKDKADNVNLAVL